MARIIVTTSSGEQTIELQPGEVFTIGRDPANKLVLEAEAGLSRRHCRISPREGDAVGWEVADLGSTNKTRVGGRIAEQKVLTDGDVIEIGSVRIRFEDPEEAKHLEDLGKEGVCYLEWVSGDRKGERVLLVKKCVTIGRRDANTVVIDDRMVSGHHAEIDRDINGYTIRDLGSTNGTLVNGEPISEALLTHGARVRIGNGRFAFKDPSMKDVEVELAHFEEDDGWGMMGEIDLSRARGSRGGLAVVFLFILAAVVGGWWLSQETEGASDATRGARGGHIANADFDLDDLLWSADRDEDTTVSRNTRGGRSGPWLSMKNAGKAGSGVVLVTYDEPIETVGARPLDFRAQLRASGGEGATLVAVWASEPTPEELRAGVTSLERTDVLATARGGWKSVNEVRTPPVWARTVRLGVLLPEETGAGLDAVGVTTGSKASARPALVLPSRKTAYVDDRGCLDLLLPNRTVLLTGAAPVVRLPGGEVLETFHASSPPQEDDTGVTIEGAFDGPDGDVPARLVLTKTDDGLRVEITCEGAEAVGLDAEAPAAHVGRTVSVLGDFLPQRMPVRAGEKLEAVSRILIGDPDAGTTSTSTLLAIVQDENRPIATFSFLPSADEGLVAFRQWVEGTGTSVELVSDFTQQRRQAKADLGNAKRLVSSAPGQAIAALRDVAQAYPFEASVRDDAVRLAGELETQARLDVGALAQALGEFRIYGSPEALARAEELASRLEGQFLGEKGRGGSLETELSDLVAQVQSARYEFEVEQASPGMDRLERLVGLLAKVEGYRPMAALYARTMLRRYEHLAEEAEDIARRLQAARERLEDLEKNDDVRNALPPVPER